MYKFFCHLVTLLILPICLLANDYDKAWEALHENNRKQALEYLEKAMNDPASVVDAYLTYIYLKTFEGNEQSVKDFDEKILDKVKDPNPYLFALWFNEAALGNYGKKTEKRQLELIKEILADNRFNGSLRSAAHYFNGLSLLDSKEFEKAKKEWDQMGSVTQWQIVGPFENLSRSGFDKSYGPLEHPEKDAAFKSLTNALINWFSPPHTNNDGWFFIQPHLPNRTAVTYAQSFIDVPAEMDVLINAGVNGSIKVWVNDALVIAEERERVTELDCYKSACHLKKGYNRILVQVGYTNNSIPNFIIRLTDNNFNTIPNVAFTAETQAYQKQATVDGATKPLPHFAESFFEEKIKKQPDNLINYILLSQTYLRNKKTYEARKVIEEALQKDPKNSLLRFELMQCFVKEENRTLLSEEIERIKEKDPGCYLVYQLKINQLLDEEKYDEGSKLLDEMISLYGEDQETFSLRIRILDLQKKIEEELREIQKAYEKYPDHPDFVRMMFNLKKDNLKDNDAAIAIYEKFLKNTFNYAIYKDLGQEYIDEGKKDKGLQVMNKILELFPFDADFITNMAKYYFEQQNYSKALDFCKQSLQLAPYVATYWNNKGIIEEQMGKTEDAVASYSKALYYDSKLYDARKKLRSLQNKTDLYKFFPATDVYALIQKSVSKTVSQDYDYSYLLDEKLAILYAEGASEEYSTFVFKINTEKGIDKWKDSYIPFNEYTQSLLIEKAEVVKKNGNRLSAEQNQNEMVFTNLEVGDAIVIKYRIQNYARGRLAKEFWDTYLFNAFVPSDISRYSLLVDKDLSFTHQMINSEIKPEIKQIEDFTLYTWEMKDLEPVKDEPFMPTLNDVGIVLHLSTVKSWNDIAQWYSDLSSFKTENEFELKEVYGQLFPGGEKLNELEKARRIYNYIETNYRYSSVSFRQSDFVPQRASVTINTRLGDCKDLSSLFTSLARMAGLRANMVLVDTKDNGTKEMMLPSVDFNHCIVSLQADGRQYYLELTDNNLPFASLPDNLAGASSLFIPRDQDKMTSNLEPISTTNRTPNKTKKTINVNIIGDDLRIQVEAVKKGNLTSSLRDQYKNLSAQKKREEMEKSISGSFKNPLKLESITFTPLDSLVDSIKYKYSYTVKNEVAEVGSMSMFKIPFGDVIATIDNFSSDERKFPIEYWRYEDADEYESAVSIQLPAGKQFIELPTDQSFKFKKNTYSIRFIKSGKDKLTVIRKASLSRDDISPSEYSALKDFFNNIIKTESKYIAYK